MKFQKRKSINKLRQQVSKQTKVGGDTPKKSQESFELGVLWPPVEVTKSLLLIDLDNQLLTKFFLIYQYACIEPVVSIDF